MKRILLFVFFVALFMGLACDEDDFRIKNTPTPERRSLDIDIGEWNPEDVSATTR